MLRFSETTDTKCGEVSVSSSMDAFRIPSSPSWHVIQIVDFLHSTMGVIPLLCNSLHFRKRQTPNVSKCSA